jgi:hypothetical protein
MTGLRVSARGHTTQCEDVQSGVLILTGEVRESRHVRAKRLEIRRGAK